MTASTVHMALLGADGLERVAADCINNTEKLLQKLTSISGVELLFTKPRFHEAVLGLNQSAEDVLAQLAERNILGGYNLKNDFPDLGEAILICATEMRNDDDIEAYYQALLSIMGKETVVANSANMQGYEEC